MAQIDALLERALVCGASDLHLRAGSPPLMRLHGRLQPLAEVDGFTAVPGDNSPVTTACGFESELLALASGTGVLGDRGAVGG